jgi:hypothetical protein
MANWLILIREKDGGTASVGFGDYPDLGYAMFSE